MSQDLKGMRVVVTGRFKSGSRRGLERRLRGLGIKVCSTVTTKIDFLITGASPSSALGQARGLNVRVIDETQLERLLAGQTLGEDETATVHKAVKTEAPNKTLTQLRQLLHAPPSSAQWFKVCKVLDQCKPQNLEVALDYIEGSAQRWQGKFAGFHTALSQTNPNNHSYPENEHFHRFHLDLTSVEGLDPRAMPLQWQKRLMQGEFDPRFAAIRVLGFHKVKVSTRVARHILACPHLNNVRALYLPSRSISPKFVRELAAHDGLPALTHLDISNAQCNVEGALTVCHHPNMDRLEHLSLNMLNVPFDNLERLPAGLKSLDLSRNPQSDNTTLDADLLAPLQLQALGLRHTNLTPSLLRRLLRSGTLRGLQCLSIGYNNLAQGLDVLLECFPEHLPELKVLDLRGVGLYPKDAKVLAWLPWLASLTQLHINTSTTTRTEAVIKILRASPHLQPGALRAPGVA